MVNEFSSKYCYVGVITMTNSTLTYRCHYLELKWNSGKFFSFNCTCKRIQSGKQFNSRVIRVMIDKSEESV